MKNMVKIAVVQLKSTANKSKNYLTCKELIENASKESAKIVFLPENFDFISENRQQGFDLSEDINGELINSYKSLAKSNNIFLSLGGFHRKDLSFDGKMFNTHVFIDNKGNIKETYDKLHLFDVEIPGHVSLKESNAVQSGQQLKSPVDSPIGKIGLGICYDLRFPEMSQALRENGADILTFPSAFTKKTGEAHWHVLLRARAIENQCFVIAAAQEGQHNEKRVSYGHSMVVDPWGEIIAEIKEPGPGIVIANIDLDKIAECRINMPVFNHKRKDLFPSQGFQGAACDIGKEVFNFGAHIIQPDCVFYKSFLAFAFVNISPLVPGHVLVSPIRKVERFEELSPMEVVELFSVVRLIAPRLERYYNANSLTISLQDGVDAGQTVPHIHIHVLPRKPGDFPENDDIYKQMQKHDKSDNKERKFRTKIEMSKEAEEFRKLFYTN